MEEVEGVDYILCRLCDNGKHYKMLSAFHMKKLHNTTLSDYQTQFPGAKIICQKTLDKRSKSRQRRITLICQWCGEDFEVQPHKKDQKYCGEECERASRCGDNNVSKRPEVRKILSEQKMGDKNPSKRPEVRKKISESKKGKKLSPETCQKMSDAKKGVPKPESFRQFMRDHNPSQRPEVAAKISASKMGHEVTEETIEKIKKAWTPELKEQAKDNLNARRDDVNKAIEEFWADPQNREEQSKIKKQIQNKPEVKKKVGDASRKRWQDPEYHEKQCETHKQFWADPEEREKQRQRQLEHWEEHPEKREEYSERFSGKDNPNYKDGKCHEGRGPGWDKIRKAIRERDGHCQMCGVLESTDGDGLDAHHVDGDKHNHAYRNLIALCNKCHSSLNNRELFDIWQRIFESMIDLKYGLQISNA